MLEYLLAGFQPGYLWWMLTLFIRGDAYGPERLKQSMLLGDKRLVACQEQVAHARQQHSSSITNGSDCRGGHLISPWQFITVLAGCKLTVNYIPSWADQGERPRYQRLDNRTGRSYDTHRRQFG